MHIWSRWSGTAQRRVGCVKKVDGKVNADSLQSLTLRLAGCEGESRANRELAVAESHLGPTLLVGFRDIRGMRTRWPAKSPVIISASMTLRPRRLQVRRVPLHIRCFESRFRSSMIRRIDLERETVWIYRVFENSDVYSTDAWLCSSSTESRE